MKIKNLGMIYITIAVLVLGYIIFSVYTQFRSSQDLKNSMRVHQEALIQVNEFHVLANNQVLKK